MFCCFVFFFKQKTAYEMRISDWSSDVCSSDLRAAAPRRRFAQQFRIALHRLRHIVRSPRPERIERMDRALERDLLMLKDRRTRCPRLQPHLGRARGPLDRARAGAVLAAIGPPARTRRPPRLHLQPLLPAAPRFPAPAPPPPVSPDRLPLAPL